MYDSLEISEKWELEAQMFNILRSLYNDRKRAGLCAGRTLLFVLPGTAAQ